MHIHIYICVYYMLVSSLLHDLKPLYIDWQTLINRHWLTVTDIQTLINRSLWSHNLLCCEDSQNFCQSLVRNHTWVSAAPPHQYHSNLSNTGGVIYFTQEACFSISLLHWNNCVLSPCIYTQTLVFPPNLFLPVTSSRLLCSWQQQLFLSTDWWV